MVGIGSQPLSPPLVPRKGWVFFFSVLVVCFLFYFVFETEELCVILWMFWILLCTSG